MKKISVLGAGSWGTALALVLAQNNYEVSIWTANQTQCDNINITRENKEYLPGIYIDESISITTNIEESINGSDFIVLAVPSQAIRTVCNNICKYITTDQIIINAAKGLEKGSGLRLSEVCKQELPNNKYAVLSGPSHAEEVAKRVPTTLVVASKDFEVAERVQDIFMNNDLRVYINTDIIGVEIGGALKNIIAFGVGICDGLGYGDNTKAALMTRGINEISRFGIAIGAERDTFGGLSGIGDLIVTCSSVHSRNRTAGILIGKGLSLDETLEKVKMVVEGITATQVAHELSLKLGIDMPITNAIYNILYSNENISDVVKSLMLRDKTHEIECI